MTLRLVEGVEIARLARAHGDVESPAVAVVCDTLDDVRELAARASEVAHSVRAVLASYIPGLLVALFSASGIAALRLDGPAAKLLKGQKAIVLPPPSQWVEGQPTTVLAGGARLAVTWLARGTERAWATGRAPLPLPNGAPASRLQATVRGKALNSSSD